MSQYMQEIRLISINSIFSGYDITNSIVSIYHIRNSIVSIVHNVLYTSGSAIYFNCLKTLAGHDHPKVSTGEPDKFFVLLTQSFVKFEDKIRVINFEPIEMYFSWMILQT